MEEVLIKVAPTVYDILEATIRAAIEFTEAEAGHIFLIKRLEDQVLVSHQCLLTDKGVIIRQYEEDRPFMYGPCQRSIEEGKMYYVHDAESNPLHRLLLAELGRIMRKGHEDGLKRKYLQDYLEFLARARSYISVPIKGLHTEPIGALALYSYASEDYFGAMKKRIIEEYMDNFASALIISLIEKASQENQRMKELLESYGEGFLAEVGMSPGSLFDVRETAEFRGVGTVVEQLLRRAEEKTSWNEIIEEFHTHMARCATAQDRFWYSIQAFLVAAGNISKLFWPSEEQKQRLPERGSELRASLAVGDNSPLKPRGFRDRFEHFDVCLETWAAKPHHHFFDANIGPEAMWFGGFKPNPETYLRNFDTTTFAITIQGETYHLRPIIDAIQVLYPRAVARRQELSAGF